MNIDNDYRNTLMVNASNRIDSNFKARHTASSVLYYAIVFKSRIFLWGRLYVRLGSRVSGLAGVSLRVYLGIRCTSYPQSRVEHIYTGAEFYKGQTL